MEKKQTMTWTIYILLLCSLALFLVSAVLLGVAASQEPKQGERGERGLSAYESALQEGFRGTEQEWLESLNGARGPEGPKGEQGEEGRGIASLTQKRDRWGIALWLEITFTDGTKQDTSAEPVLLVDPKRSYQAETEGDRALLLSYGVEPARIFTKESFGEQILQGGTLALLTDITLPAGRIAQDTVLELGGNKLTISGNTSERIAENSSLTIRGGEICSDAQDAIAPQRAVFLAEKGASLTLEGVTYEGNSPVACPSEEASLLLKDCRIRTSGYYAVATNATYGENMHITIVGSEIAALRESGEGGDGDATAVLVNVPCSLKVEDSTLQGSRQALVVRCGSAVLRNSVLTVTGSYPDRDKYLSETWSQGNEVPAAALVAGNRSYAAYRSPASLSLSSVRISAPDALFGVYLYGNEREAEGVSFDYDNECELGKLEVGGGSVTVNGERSRTGVRFPFPELPFLRRFR